MESPTAHVVFPLEVVDGWPPVSAERVWAHELGDDRYRVDNVPWFVRDLAVDDVVVALAPDEDQNPVYQRHERKSDHLTIRVVCWRDGPLRGHLERVVEVFTPLGVYAEGAEQWALVALDVPPETDLQTLRERLVAGRDDGSWDWEEGRVNDRWLQTPPPRRSWRRRLR